MKARLRLGRESPKTGASKGRLHLLRSLLNRREGRLALLLERNAGWEPCWLGDEASLNLGQLLRLKWCWAPR